MAKGRAECQAAAEPVARCLKGMLHLPPGTLPACLPPYFSSSTDLRGVRSDSCASLFTGCRLPAACCCMACSLR